MRGARSMRGIIGPTRGEVSSAEDEKLGRGRQRVDLRELVVDARAVARSEHRLLGLLVERVPEQSRRLDAHLRVRRQAALENLRRQLLAAVLTEQDDRAVGAEVVEQRLVGEQLVRAWRPIEEP